MNNDKYRWNYSKKFLENKIFKYIKKLFNINIKTKMKCQYIFMNLKHMFKLNKIFLKYNNKNRNINTFIRNTYGGFIKFIKLKGKKYFNYDNIEKTLYMI